MHQDIELIQERIQKLSRFVAQIRAEVGKVIVGQRYMIDRLLIGLLAIVHPSRAEAGCPGSPAPGAGPSRDGWTIARTIVAGP